MFWAMLERFRLFQAILEYGQLRTVSVSGPFRANMSCFNAFQVVSASVGPFQAVFDRFKAFQAVLS